MRASRHAALWFPTVRMNLAFKMELPEEGVDWSAVRVTSKQIEDRKFDLNMLARILDSEILGHFTKYFFNPRL